jgi:hypothetical protein
LLGQMINKVKSVVLFSTNTMVQRKREVYDLLQMMKGTMNERYLGLPVWVGWSKSSTFAYLKDWVWNRTHEWKEKFFVMGGKGDLYQSSGPGHPYICDGLLWSHKNALWPN